MDARVGADSRFQHVSRARKDGETMGVLRSVRRVVIVILCVVPWVIVVAASDDSVEVGTQQTEPEFQPEDTSWMTTDYADLAWAAKTAGWSACTPARVAVFNSRVHVKCAVANAGILYYAFPTADQAAAARFLAIHNSALLTGRSLTILNDPADTTSGPPVGCQASDCRLIIALDIF
jgi:hypothetical protein